MTKATQFRPDKVRPAGKIHGGKAYLCRRILEEYPPLPTIKKHVEVFGGLGSVSLNLPEATREQPRIDIYCDVNWRLNNFFACLRQWPKEMQVALTLTPYSEAELNQTIEAAMDAARTGWRPKTKAERIEQARQQFVSMQMSFGGQGDSFSRTKARTRRGIADCVAGYLSTIHDELPKIIERVTTWQQEARGFEVTIPYHDGEGSHFYADPTYHPDCRTSPDVYANEMTVEQHEQFLGLAQHTTGTMAISHYRHELYDHMLKDWRRIDWDIANHAAGGAEKRRMTECLYMNY